MTSEYKLGDHCPRCDSPAPHLHPAMQFEGEVQECSDPYHLIPTNQNGGHRCRHGHYHATPEGAAGCQRPQDFYNSRATGEGARDARPLEIAKDSGAAALSGSLNIPTFTLSFDPLTGQDVEGGYEIMRAEDVWHFFARRVAKLRATGEGR